MFKKIFNSKTNNFTFAAILISGSTVLSAILGLLRDRLLASTFGAGETLDVYFSAFRIPDLLQSILVAGGLNAIFLPLFSFYIQKGHKKAFEFANNLLHWTFLFLGAISCIAFFLAPYLVKFIVPGFGSIQVDQTIILTRILLLGPVFFGLSAIFSGILQYFDYFLAYSLAPVLYNIGIIFGIIFLTPIFDIYGLAAGVILGTVMYFLIQMVCAKNSGYKYEKVCNLRTLNLKEILRLIIPPSIGTSCSQINLIVITALASILMPGTLAIFTFSRNLQGLPIAIIGAPFAVAVFPVLSKNWPQNKEKFWQSFSLALSQILFLTIPVSVLMFLLRGQLVRIVLGAGLWGWTETRLTAACLGIFSFSILGYSLIPLFQRGFYAIQDTKTPTILQVMTVLANIFFVFLFLLGLKYSNIFQEVLKNFLKLADISHVEVIAFPLSLTISNIFETLLLFFIFAKKAGFHKLVVFFYSLKNIFFLTFLMGITTWITLKPLALIFPLANFWNVFFQTFLGAGFGGLVYILGAFILKLPEIKMLKDSFFAR